MLLIFSNDRFGLNKVVEAISELNKTETGQELVAQLQNSCNNFIIKQAKDNPNGDKNEFEPFNSIASWANIEEMQKATGNTTGSMGSGGIVYWDPNNVTGGLNADRSIYRPSYIGLGHEFAHAGDSDLGLLYSKYDFKTYRAKHNGLLKCEWRAVYKENLIRSQVKSPHPLPLRMYYGYELHDGEWKRGIPPMLIKDNNPINY